MRTRATPFQEISLIIQRLLRAAVLHPGRPKIFLASRARVIARTYARTREATATSFCAGSV
jgi:hypothetical protein